MLDQKNKDDYIAFVKEQYDELRQAHIASTTAAAAAGAMLSTPAIFFHAHIPLKGTKAGVDNIAPAAAAAVVDAICACRSSSYCSLTNAI